MPDVYSERVALEFHVPGALTTAATTMRRVIPFPYAIIGAVASVNTAPAGSNIVFDVVAGPNGTVENSLVSIWSLNNGTNVQTVTLTGTITGGTFTLTQASQTTAGIAYNATAAAVQSALNALASPAEDVSVTGSAGGPWTVTFLGGAAPSGALMTASAASLTGTSPGVTVARAATATDHRPTIVAGSNDQAPIASSTFTVAPEGTDPVPQGQTAGVSTTYENPDPFPYLAKPDPNSAAPTVTFGGNQPFNESPVSPIDISTQSGADLEAAGANQLPAGGTVGYVGNAGDAINLVVAAVGSGTAGSDATVTVYIVPQ